MSGTSNHFFFRDRDGWHSSQTNRNNIEKGQARAMSQASALVSLLTVSGERDSLDVPRGREEEGEGGGGKENGNLR